MLWNCQIKYNGNKEYTNEIRYSNGPLKLDVQGENIDSSVVSRLSYEYKEPILPPSLFTNLQGKKFIVPTWQEVHPETTLDDINWIKPEVKVKAKIETVEVGKYVIKFNGNKEYYTCNCQGFWRVKDKSVGCKHIQEYKAKLK